MIAASGRGSAVKPHAPKAASPGGGHQHGGATRGEETGVSAEGATCVEVAARERWVRAGGYTSSKKPPPHAMGGGREGAWRMHQSGGGGAVEEAAPREEGAAAGHRPPRPRPRCALRLLGIGRCGQRDSVWPTAKRRGKGGAHSAGRGGARREFELARAN